MVRTAGAPADIPAAAKSISESLDPKLFPEIRQMKVLYRDKVSGAEKTAMVVSLIGLVAVFVAGVGILGMVMYTVSQRTKEIAIRLALGAQPFQVLSSVLRQFTWPVLLGLVAGVAGTAAVSRILREVLYGINNLDPLSYAAAIAVLLSIAGLAALLPARRALRLDIARALHQE
jgi:ABC-type antimicrobial peptide transport system permease subunit